MPSENFYFVLATALPVLTVLLVIIWRYYSGRSAQIEEALKKGRFGSNVAAAAAEAKKKPSSGNTVRFEDLSFVDRGDATAQEVTDEMGNKLSRDKVRKDNKCKIKSADHQRRIVEDDDEDKSSDTDLWNEKLKDPKSVLESDDETDIQGGKSDTEKDNDSKRFKKRSAKYNTADGFETALPDLKDLEMDLQKAGLDKSMIDSIPGKMKKSKFVALNKKIEEGMTEQQKQEEADVRRSQLEQIFRMMKEQEEKLGVNSTEDVTEQMKLYAL